MQIYAKPYAIKYTSTLKDKAIPGDNLLIIDTNLQWKVGDKIVITTTDHDDTHTE